MTDSTTPDEQPKKRVARRVVAEKRRYFVPEHGVSVEADTPQEAVEKARKQVGADDSDESKEAN